MKQGWKTELLGELCDIRNGSTPSKGHAAFWEGGTIPWFTIDDMREQGRAISSTRQKITKSALNETSVKLLPEDSVLLCCTASVGEFAITRIPLTTNQQFNGLVIKNRNQLDPNFLFHYAATLKDELLGLSGKTTIDFIPISRLRDVTVPVPPLAEQHRIVGLLDEAFEGLATAKANAEKNLQNARALFESHLQSVFTQRGETRQEQAKSPTRTMLQKPSVADDAATARLNAGYVTKTGGREATLRHIPGNLSLAVGMPKTGARKGWRWSALTELARLESGHTPSRRHPEYWGGSVPWIGIQDARENHGQRISDTFQKTNELGIANSSARVLPENTVCLSRTASVGYIVVMGRPMATSQDFVNWVCSDKLQPEFLKFLILAEGREGLLRYASGSVHQTIYFPEAKAFHICYPDPKEQLRIVKQCDGMYEETQRLARLYERKLAALEALKKSLLHQAFSGQL